jgi:hypothetical protein
VIDAIMDRDWKVTAQRQMFQIDREGKGTQSSARTSQNEIMTSKWYRVHHHHPLPLCINCGETAFDNVDLVTLLRRC